MTTTDTNGECATLAAALASFQRELPKIGKGNTAEIKSDKGRYTYSYADLAEVSAIVLPRLAQFGLSWTAMPTMDDAQRFVLRYELLHTSGENRTGTYPLPAPTSQPQTLGSAITYARRYCLCAVTGVSPDEDDDGAAAQAAAPVTERDWDAETAAAEAAGDRGRLAQLWQRAKHARPDDAALHGRIAAAGGRVKAAAEEKPAPVAESARPAERRQTNRLYALLAEGGIDTKDRPLRLRIVSQLAARPADQPLGSFDELTWDEAERVNAHLQKIKDDFGASLPLTLRAIAEQS